MTSRRFLAILFSFVCPLAADADVFRWDNDRVIPGTEGIATTVNADLDRLNLEFAALQDLDLTGANFKDSNLSQANFRSSILKNTDLSGANLTGAELRHSVLMSANMTAATITGANLNSATNGGFTSQQLYSTASYQARNLQGVGLWLNDLRSWDFSDQDLTNASLAGAQLQGTNFSNAIVTGTNLGDTPEFTREQLYSTASYKSKNLARMGLWFKDLTDWDLSGQNLTNVSFRFSTLTDVSLTDATIVGANFGGVIGISAEQIYSTASYRENNLQRLAIWLNDLSGWNFANQNLTGASFGSATVTNTRMTGANLSNAFLSDIIGQPIFDSASKYNQWTVFSDGFDPINAGLTFVESANGDFDADNVLDITDLNMLFEFVHADESVTQQNWLRPMFDLNRDAIIDQLDLTAWIKDVRRTWMGDSNLDGEFSTSDLVQVFQFGQYEDDINRNSTWASGDWNGDQDFTTSDLVVAFQDGGFEAGPRTNLLSVPEPSAALLLLTATLSICASQRRSIAKRQRD